MTSFGNLIIKKRAALNLTQKELSLKLGFEHAQQLCNIEIGAAPFPPKHIPKLAKFLGVEQSYLVAIMMEDIEKDIWEKIKSK